MRTRRAKPRLASQAAMVRSRIRVVALGRPAITWFMGMTVDKMRRAASIARRAVRRWVRWRRKAARVNRVAINKMVEGEKVVI